jgi:hypothetical protein
MVGWDAAPMPGDNACQAPLGAGPGLAGGGPFVGGFVRMNALEQVLAQSDTVPFREYQETSSVIPVDLDGDGLVDLIDNRLGGGTWVVRQGPAGTFTNVAALQNAPTSLQQCYVAADLDGDGYVDVYCTNPHAVVWGRPGGPDWTRQTILAPRDVPDMATVAWDLDEDGLLDLVDAPFGPAKVVWRNHGDRTFDNVSQAWGLAVPGLTWEVGFVDFDGDGRLDVYIGNDGDGKQNYALRALGPGAGGEPGFQQIQPWGAACDHSGLFTFGNENPMGVALGDVDGDGHFEVYFANAGLETLLSQQADSSWRDATPQLFQQPMTDHGHFLIPFSPHFWDIDHDGLLELLVPGGDDQGFHMDPARAQDQSTVLLYHGLPGSRFEEAQAAVGLADLGQYISLSTVDLDGDGDLDLIVGGWEQQPRVWQNQVAPAGNHLLLSLHGRTSNPYGLGAQVTATAGGLRRVYQVGDTFQPRVGIDPVLDVALGAATQLDELRVLWPSGYEQVVRGLPAGGHQTVEEPPLIAIQPSSRHVPADGTSTVTVVVRPVDANGAALAAAMVSIEAPFHTVQWAGPATVRGDGATVRTLVAPRTAGSAVVEASVGGKPYRIRPRVWFD